MANGRKNAWRDLSLPERFLYLANHYGSPDEFARASALAPKTARRMFRLLGVTEPSSYDWRELKALFNNSPDVAEGIAHARRNMMAANRLIEKSARKGKYVAPIGRVGDTKLEPYQYALTGPSYNFISRWIGYHVEHLPDEEIFKLIRHFFELYTDTGQFNTFRFEYLTRADFYLSESQEGPKSAFKDIGLQKQYLDSDVIKLSTKPFSFYIVNNAASFETVIREEYRYRRSMGAYRITDIYFADSQTNDDIRTEHREDVRRSKIKAQKRGKRGRGKGSKGGARGR